MEEMRFLLLPVKVHRVVLKLMSSEDEQEALHIEDV